MTILEERAMSKITQVPRNEREEKLRDNGYHVMRDESYKYFAYASFAGDLYYGDSLDEAWRACNNHFIANCEESEDRP